MHRAFRGIPWLDGSGGINAVTPIILWPQHRLDLVKLGMYILFASTKNAESRASATLAESRSLGQVAGRPPCPQISACPAELRRPVGLAGDQDQRALISEIGIPKVLSKLVKSLKYRSDSQQMPGRWNPSAGTISARSRSMSAALAHRHLSLSLSHIGRPKMPQPTLSPTYC